MANAVDDFARGAIQGLRDLHIAHVEECNKRMETINGMFVSAEASRRGIHNRLNLLLLAVLGAAVGAFTWQYQQNLEMQKERIEAIAKFTTRAGE